jgi:hypothetical protein
VVQPRAEFGLGNAFAVWLLDCYASSGSLDLSMHFGISPCRSSSARMVEREAVTLPLDHAFGFELANVCPAAIEVHGQCRRADGRGLSGSRLGDGRAIIGDGLSHRVRSCCVATG